MSVERFDEKELHVAQDRYRPNTWLFLPSIFVLGLIGFRPQIGAEVGTVGVMVAVVCFSIYLRQRANARWLPWITLKAPHTVFLGSTLPVQVNRTPGSREPVEGELELTLSCFRLSYEEKVGAHELVGVYEIEHTSVEWEQVRTSPFRDLNEFEFLITADAIPSADREIGWRLTARTQDRVLTLPVKVVSAKAFGFVVN